MWDATAHQARKPRPLRLGPAQATRVGTSIAGPNDLASLSASRDSTFVCVARYYLLVTIPITDLRAQQRSTAGIHELQRDKAVVRDPKDVIGITLHQTACVFGVSEAQAKRAGGDVIAARRARALNVRCHALAFRDTAVGVVLPNPLLWLVQHGNGLSPTTLGLEAECHVEGVDGDLKTFPGKDLTKRAAVTDQLIETTREAFRILVELAAKEGAVIRFVYAHRQSSPTRRADPCERLWKACVLEYAVPRLGLQTAPDDVWKTRTGGFGRPIPEAWDPTQKGTRY